MCMRTSRLSLVTHTRTICKVRRTIFPTRKKVHILETTGFNFLYTCIFFTSCAGDLKTPSTTDLYIIHSELAPYIATFYITYADWSVLSEQV